MWHGTNKEPMTMATCECRLLKGVILKREIIHMNMLKWWNSENNPINMMDRFDFILSLPPSATFLLFPFYSTFFQILLSLLFLHIHLTSFHVSSFLSTPCFFLGKFMQGYVSSSCWLR
jgi:hypothetical protein